MIYSIFQNQYAHFFSVTQFNDLESSFKEECLVRWTLAKSLEDAKAFRQQDLFGSLCSKAYNIFSLSFLNIARGTKIIVLNSCVLIFFTIIGKCCDEVSN